VTDEQKYMRQQLYWLHACLQNLATRMTSVPASSLGECAEFTQRVKNLLSK